MARSKRSAEKVAFWRATVDEQRRGGLSVRAFCRQKGVSEPSFYAWRRKLQKRPAGRAAEAEKAADAGGNGRLIPVEVVHPTGERAVPNHATGEHAVPNHAAGEDGGPNRHGANRLLEIRTPGGYALRFDRDTTPETVARLLDVLARCDREGAASC